MATRKPAARSAKTNVKPKAAKKAKLPYAENAKTQNYMRAVVQGMQARTGKTLEEWLMLCAKAPQDKISNFQKWCKEEHGLTMTYAYTLWEAMRGNVSETLVGNPEALVDALFEKFVQQQALYTTIVKYALDRMPGVVVSPRKTYVPLVRSKQFAILRPTKQGLLLGLNMGNYPTHPRLKIDAKLTKDTRSTRWVWLSSPIDFDAEIKLLLEEAAAMN